MTNVLITGITGFLGSHIAQQYIENGFNVIGIKQSKSNLHRCEDFKHLVTWINIDEADWKDKAIEAQPTIVIHSAWLGVAASDRQNWAPQLTNLDLLMKLLEVADLAGATKFIGLGSQAEYGTFSGKINEEFPANPNTAYGAIKLMSKELVKSFCEEKKVEWYWLRLFPIFGEKEDDNWLLPSVIKTISSGKSMDLTPGEQRYAYIYVKDLANCILKLANPELKETSGVYNISSNNTVSLKQLISSIRDVVNPSIQLNFGALPYRSYQSMHMEGDIAKFNTKIYEVAFSDFDLALDRTVKYYLEKFKSNDV